MANNIGKQLLGLFLVTSNLLAVPGDENWNDPFSGEWAGGDVRSLVVQSNQVYAAGQFTSADNKASANVARWDGTNWHSMYGLSSETSIRGIATNASGLFIGGASGLMRWTGTSWEKIFSPPFVSNPYNTIDISALCGWGSQVYVAGMMRTGEYAVGRWDGSGWTTLGSSGYVNAMAMKGAELYVAGFFNSGFGGGINIARYNGGWSGLGTGVNGEVVALAVSGNDVYAAGTFTTAGGIAASRIAKWNGTTWSALGTGVNGTVFAISAVGSNIYVAGKFSSAGGIACTNLACWNGTSWVSVNAQVKEWPKALVANGNTLYVGGAIDQVNGQSTGNIFSYSGGTAQKLKSGLSYGAVNVLRTNGSNIYAGGSWRSICGTNSPAIARFDGTKWHGLGTGLKSSAGELLVNDILVRNNEVFVAGHFDSAGGIAVTNIAKWNGSTWQAVGNGSGLTGKGFGTFSSLAFLGNDLYAGGNFFFGPHLFKLTGTTWSSVNSFNLPVASLAVFNNELYVGGSFSSPYSYLAKGNGSAWSNVGSSSFSGPVQSIAVAGNNLYVGGGFYSIGSTNYGNVAKWNGTTWASLGTGVNGWVDRLHAVGDDLFIAGSFTSAGGVPAKGLARWDDTTWHPLGSGLIGPEFGVAKTFAGVANEVLVGGIFLSAGTNNCNNLASWRLKPLKLQTGRSSNSLALSWPTTLNSYTLQTTTDVSSSNWINAVQSPGVTNKINTVVTNVSGGPRFFRLKRN